jgi:hypothetical protein
MLPRMREEGETGQRAGQGVAAAPAALEAFMTRWGASAFVCETKQSVARESINPACPQPPEMAVR